MTVRAYPRHARTTFRIPTTTRLWVFFCRMLRPVPGAGADDSRRGEAATLSSTVISTVPAYIGTGWPGRTGMGRFAGHPCGTARRGLQKR